MIRAIVFILLLINISYADSNQYFIKLGSFKQLKGLERSIHNMPNSLRSHVVVVRSNGWYVPFAYYSPSKRPLYSKLSLYKRYFPDAQIHRSKNMMRHKVIRNYSKLSRSRRSYKRVQRAPHYASSYQEAPQYQNVAISEEDNTLNVPVQQRVPSLVQPLPLATVEVESSENITQKQYKNFTKQMLSGKHYYLAYKSPKGGADLLIKVSFGTHRVTYQPIMGDMQMTQANYLIENSRLYMFADSFTRDGAYSTLDEHRNNHFLVSSWANGKKLNTLRYYYHLNDAKEYLGLETSEGLASTLSEGSFDDFFLDE